MRTKLFAAALAAVALVGCAHRYAGPTYTPVPYDEAEYAPYFKQGTGTVRGQVFALTVGGDVKKGAGRDVLLLPGTKFRDQWYAEQVQQGHLATVAPDKRHEALDRKTVADGDGKFEFKGLPAGTYYAFSDITWSAPTRFGLMEQGGFVLQKIEVKDGQTTEVMLKR